MGPALHVTVGTLHTATVFHSINSVPSMMCYQLAEILISAGPRFKCDIQIFLAGEGGNFVQEACK